MNVDRAPCDGWRVLDQLDEDGTFHVLRRATPRAWADLLQAHPELAGSLREIADLLEEDA